MSQHFKFGTRRMLLGIVPIALCAAVAGYFVRQQERREAALARFAELDKVTVVEIVKEVEEICVRLGRSPKDEAELEAILGRPMPVVHDGIHPTPIFYYRTGEKDFKLKYELWATDDWVYDSTAPQAGWVQHWY
jgi:hypothetical protein